MKVLHVTGGISQRYGGSKALLGMCRELQRAGVDAQIASTNADTRGVLDVPLGVHVDVDGASVRYFATPFLRQWGFSRQLAAWLETNIAAYDVVHIHGLFSYATVAAASQAEKSNVPYIIRLMGELSPWCLRQSEWKKKSYLRWAGKRYLENAAAIHCTAEAEKSSVEHLGMQVRCAVVPLALEEADFNTVPLGSFRAKHPEIAGRRIILFLSRIDPVKGLELLIEAAAEVIRKSPDVVLVIAGQGEPAYESRIRSEVNRRGIGGYVFLAGFVSGASKAELLADADIFVLPSHGENFSMAAVEAMAAGVPVIISDQVGIQREIAEAGAGIVVTRSTAAWVHALDRLLADPDEHRRMGENARRLAADRFRWQNVIPQLTRLYDSVAQGRR